MDKALLRTRYKACESFVFRRAHLVFPLLYLVLLMLFQPAYQVDNTAIAAAAVWGDPSPHFIYPSTLMGYVLMQLRIWAPQFAWFNIVQVAINLISVLIWANCMVRVHNGKPQWKHYIAAAGLLYFINTSIYGAYFAFVCGAGMACGLIMMLRAVGKGKYHKVALGAIFVFISATMRYDSCISLIPFAGAITVYLLLTRQWKSVFVPVLASVLVAGVHLYQAHGEVYSPWEPDAGNPPVNVLKLNDARMRFCDYDDYRDAEKTQDYEAIGMSYNDKLLLLGYSFLVEQRSQPGWLEAASDVRTKNNDKFPRSFGALVERLDGYVFKSNRSMRDLLFLNGLIPVLLLTLFPLPTTWKDKRLWITASYFASFFMLWVMGRCGWSSKNSLLVLSLPLIIWGMPDTWPFADKWKRKRTLVVLLLILAVCIQGVCKLGKTFSPFHLKYHARHEAIARECAAHPELRYWMSETNWAEFALPTWSYMAAPYQETGNLMQLGQWVYLTPSVQQELKKRGIPSDLAAIRLPQSRFISVDGTISGLIPFLIKSQEEHHGIKLVPVKERDLGQGMEVYRMERVDSPPQG